MMTDEEISEFAEALEWACQEAITKGFTISNLGQCCCCPMGALIEPLGAVTHPDCWKAANALNIAADEARSFMRGFDGWPKMQWGHDERLYRLGNQFRSKYFQLA